MSENSGSIDPLQSHLVIFKTVESSPLSVKQAAGHELAGRVVLSFWFVLCLSVCQDF